MDITPKFRALRAADYKAGTTVAINGTPITFDFTMASLVRRVDRLMFRIITSNYESMVDLAVGNSPEKLLDLAFECIPSVRFARWMTGDYTVFIRGREITFSISEYDANLLKQFSAMLDRVAVEAVR